VYQHKQANSDTSQHKKRVGNKARALNHIGRLRRAPSKKCTKAYAKADYDKGCLLIHAIFLPQRLILGKPSKFFILC
jgi:hypothetical protein